MTPALLLAVMVRLTATAGDEADLRRPSLEQMTQAQLLAEYDRLEEERPGLKFPIILTAAGGGVLLYGLVFAASALSNPQNSSSGVGPPLLVAGAGAVAITVGFLVLRRYLGLRDEIDARMLRVRSLIDGSSPGQRLTPPPAPPRDDADDPIGGTIIIPIPQAP